MGLVLGKKETRKIRVTVDEPGDLIELKKHSFEIEFKVIKKGDLDGIRQAYKSGDDASADAAVLNSIINIDGIKDDAGTAIPYSKSALGEDLIETRWAWRGITEAFFNVQEGVTQQDYVKAKLKN